MNKNRKVSYNDCKGSNFEYIILKSCDGHEFWIHRKVAQISETLRTMLEEQYKPHEEGDNIIKLGFESNVLRVVCSYLYFCSEYMNFEGEIPDFEIEPSIALPVYEASNFLKL